MERTASISHSYSSFPFGPYILEPFAELLKQIKLIFPNGSSCYDLGRLDAPNWSRKCMACSWTILISWMAFEAAPGDAFRTRSCY